ncbi:MAG: sigma-70 family RNA polymerase sigma factor [Pseudomonadota bacterium]|nr:sigma-70 family RNA polymerase sigma factor [Pseudomonadota bacterium]
MTPASSRASTSAPVQPLLRRPGLRVAAPPRGPGNVVPVSTADLVAQRPYLVGFAMRKLRDPMLAEDAVQDVLEAVLSGRASFGGHSALRSWLTAVLKNKIVDLLRRIDHHEVLDDAEDDGSALAVACPRPRPDQVAEQRQELARALDRIERLPAPLREAIRLRALEDRSTESICAELGISEENLFVRVHRARKQLLS